MTLCSSLRPGIALGVAAVVITSSAVVNAKSPNVLPGASTPASAPVPISEPVPLTTKEDELPPLIPPDSYFKPLVPLGGSQVDCDTAKACEKIAIQKYQEGNFREAAALFLKTHDLAPESPTKPHLLFNAARAYEDGGDPNTALSCYREYIKDGNAKGKTQIKIRSEALLFYAKGLELITAKDYNNGIKQLLRAQILLSGKPDNPPVSLCVDLGQAYEVAGRNDKALSQYQTCLFQTKYPLIRNGLEERIANLSPPVATAPEYPLPKQVLSDAAKNRVEEASTKIPVAEEIKERSYFSQHIGSLVSVGIALLATSAGVGLNSMGMSKFEKMRSGCGQSGGCSDSEIRSLEGYFQGRNIAYAAAGVAGAAAVSLFLWESLNNPKTLDVENK